MPNPEKTSSGRSAGEKACDQSGSYQPDVVEEKLSKSTA
jgi:hypothetical protein